MLVGVTDPLNTLVTIAALFTALGIIARFGPTSKGFRWLWRRNISEPVSGWADRLITLVVKREVKDRDENGGTNLDDLGQQLTVLDGRVHDMKNQLVVVHGTQVMHDERLEEVGRVAVEARDLSRQAIAEQAELAAELVAVTRQGRREDVDEIVAHVEAVHDEVRTLNGQTLAALADADETRRIQAIPDAERTAPEQDHIDVLEGDPE